MCTDSVRLPPAWVAEGSGLPWTSQGSDIQSRRREQAASYLSMLLILCSTSLLPLRAALPSRELSCYERVVWLPIVFVLQANLCDVTGCSMRIIRCTIIYCLVSGLAIWTLSIIAAQTRSISDNRADARQGTASQRTSP
ncbi:hypothetical protein V8C44DRAFT_159625 [Trichoderma aethiopicum]